MRNDDDIKRDVELELEWEPDIDAKNIAVKVSTGVVTLTGANAVGSLTASATGAASFTNSGNLSVVGQTLDGDLTVTVTKGIWIVKGPTTKVPSVLTD